MLKIRRISSQEKQLKIWQQCYLVNAQIKQANRSIRYFKLSLVSETQKINALVAVESWCHYRWPKLVHYAWNLLSTNQLCELFSSEYIGITFFSQDFRCESVEIVDDMRINYQPWLIVKETIRMNQEMLSLMSSLYFVFQEGLIKIALAWLRIAPVMFLLPFLSNKLLNGGIIKNCVVAYIALGLWPFFSSHAIQWDEINFVDVFIYEISIGLVLALILALPFMIANVIGELIDAQRGETISSIVDPASGSEASELAVLLSHITCMVFLAQGGMYQLANIFAQSYQLLPFAHGYTYKRFGNVTA